MIIYLRDSKGKYLFIGWALFPVSSVLRSSQKSQLERAVFFSRWKQLGASGKGCRVIVSPSPLTDLLILKQLQDSLWNKQHPVLLAVLPTAWQRKHTCLKRMGFWSKLQCLFTSKGFVCSPVLGDRDGVSSLAGGVETSAKRVSPSPSAEGTTPSSASSSSLSSLPGETHAV